LSSTADANDTRERAIPLSVRPQYMGRVHHVDLASLFRISTIVGINNSYARLQEGKVIAIGN